MVMKKLNDIATKTATQWKERAKQDRLNRDEITKMKDMFIVAIEIVEKEFKGKVDKGGNPYINHLWRVMERVKDFTIYPKEKEETVALLHDLMEDIPEWNEDRLRKTFPTDVVDALVCLTKKSSESYDDYIERVLTNKMATIVKRADLEDNMDITRLNELTEKDFIRLKKYHKAYKLITDK
jgi:(p)ppGpp synthase/HD superfamily hydrolase